MDANLLEKTELWVNEITLENANLSLMAEAVAEVLQLEKSKVLVVDVRMNHITFDVLEKKVSTENIIGKEKEILKALSKTPGVRIKENSSIHSNGILGLICVEPAMKDELLEKVSNMTNEIQSKIAKRAIIFPTGFEICQNLIEDTNTPYLKNLMEQHGFQVSIGETIEDNQEDVYAKLSDALSRGFGLILTTGGVGAENKDYMVEGICKLDPNAAVPYIIKFQKGTGRHVKDGVRIGVGSEGLSLMVSLPGPHDEVKAAAPILIKGLQSHWGKTEMANNIASVLAEKWRYKEYKHHHE